jgi:hypothetical protein
LIRIVYDHDIKISGVGIDQVGERFILIRILLQESSNSPLLWSDRELENLLKGSPVLPEIQNRKSALKQQWQALQESFFTKDPNVFPQGKSLYRMKS